MSETNAMLSPATTADFSFAPDETLDSLGGAASRFAHNVAAIKLLKQLEAENRPSDMLAGNEQCILSHYSGWGDTEVPNRAFPRGAYSWAEPSDEIKGLLTEEETESLRASTLNAHYTRLDVIRAIYAAIEHPELVAKGIRDTGSWNYGGPITTAGGLVFIGATNYDRKFRAFDKATGKLLWETVLPFAGNATPSTYEVNGRQFVVIAAGGGKRGAPSGGSYVAFALPKEEPT